jgi:hypothetical protein
MAVLILIYTSLILHFGSGPLWDSYIHSVHTDTCKKNWWTAIFHIQNYVYPTEMVRIRMYVSQTDWLLHIWR